MGKTFADYYDVQVSGEIPHPTFVMPDNVSKMLKRVDWRAFDLPSDYDLQNELLHTCRGVLKLEKHVFLGVENDDEYGQLITMLVEDFEKKITLLTQVNQMIRELSWVEKTACIAFLGDWLRGASDLKEYYFRLGGIKYHKDNQKSGKPPDSHLVMSDVDTLRETRGRLSKFLPSWGVVLRSKTDGCSEEMSCLDLQEKWLTWSPPADEAEPPMIASPDLAATPESERVVDPIDELIAELENMIAEMDVASLADIGARLDRVKAKFVVLKENNATRLAGLWQTFTFLFDVTDLTASDLDGLEEYASKIGGFTLGNTGESLPVADRLAALKETIAPYADPAGDKKTPPRFEKCEGLLKKIDAQITQQVDKKHIKVALRSLLTELKIMKTEKQYCESLSIFGHTKTRRSKAIARAEAAITKAVEQDDKSQVDNFYNAYDSFVKQTRAELVKTSSRFSFSFFSWRPPSTESLAEIAVKFEDTSKLLKQMSQRG